MAFASLNGIQLVVKDRLRAPQSLESVGLEGVNLLDILAEFDPYGVWCLDLETAAIRWSPDCSKIIDLPANGGTTGLFSLFSMFHEEDRTAVALCIERAIENRSGFRFVLRVPQACGEIKLVKMAGQYRVTASGREELYGTLSEFQDRVRAIALCDAA